MRPRHASDTPDLSPQEPSEPRRKSAGAAFSTEHALRVGISHTVESPKRGSFRLEEFKDDTLDLERSEERTQRKKHYLQQLEALEEAGATLREAWSDLIRSSNHQLLQLRRELDVRRLERDDKRRTLKETRERCAAERAALINALTTTKLTIAELSLEIDDINLKLRQPAPPPQVEASATPEVA